MQVEKDPTPLAHGRPRHFRAEHLARISTPGDREGYPPRHASADDRLVVDDVDHRAGRHAHIVGHVAVV